jgi:hypothetical protein
VRMRRKKRRSSGSGIPEARGHENQTAVRFYRAAHHDDVFGALRGAPAEVGRGKTLVFAASALGRSLSPLNISVFQRKEIGSLPWIGASYNYRWGKSGCHLTILIKMPTMLYRLTK